MKCNKNEQHSDPPVVSPRHDLLEKVPEFLLEKMVEPVGGCARLSEISEENLSHH